MSSYTDPILCHVQLEHLPEWFGESVAIEKSTWKTHGLDEECTLLWLKERYPSHTQELNLLSLLFLCPSCGGAQKCYTDTSPGRLAPHPQCLFARSGAGGGVQVRVLSPVS